jgi:hypothetical protein
VGLFADGAETEQVGGNIDENKKSGFCHFREKNRCVRIYPSYTLSQSFTFIKIYTGSVGLQLLLDGAPQLLGGSVQVAGAHHAVQAVVGGRLGGTTAGIASGAACAGTRAGATSRGEFGPRDPHQLDIVHPRLHSKTKIILIKQFQIMCAQYLISFSIFGCKMYLKWK